MELSPVVVADAWHRLVVARVARLATAGAGHQPHLVPCCLAVDGMTAYSIVDDKPKTTRRLQRLADVAIRPGASLLVDHYDEDWGRLWWVRASGPAEVVEPGGPRHDRAAALLAAKYRQYVTHRLDGPALAIELTTWRSWAAAPGR